MPSWIGNLGSLSDLCIALVNIMWVGTREICVPATPLPNDGGGTQTFRS